jgi:hypothetical protein
MELSEPISLITLMIAILIKKKLKKNKLSPIIGKDKLGFYPNTEKEDS